MTFYSWCFSHWRLSLQDHSLPPPPKPHHHPGWLQCLGRQANHNYTSHNSVRATESLWALWEMRPHKMVGGARKWSSEGGIRASEQGLLMSSPEVLMWWTSQSLQENSSSYVHLAVYISKEEEFVVKSMESCCLCVANASVRSTTMCLVLGLRPQATAGKKSWV